MDTDLDFPNRPLWRTSPPYWDQKMGKRLKVDWTFYFIQYSADGGETYHAYKPRGFAALRVGRLGDIEQTATWNQLYGEPSPPPGNGWVLHRKQIGFCFWRRTAIVELMF